MSVKRFISSIYLSGGAAVLSLNDITIINTDPLNTALFYADHGADELLIFDLSKNDEEQQNHLDIIKEIADKVSVPIIGAGNISRMEDVKKLLYAGCQKAALNYARESNIAITEEVSAKFGSNRIVACVGKQEEITDNEAILTKFVSEMIIIDEYLIRYASDLSILPLILHIQKISLDKIIELLTIPVNAAIAGNSINRNAKELYKIKDLCRENGITLSEFVPEIGFAEFALNSDGLVPVIVQEHDSNEVLMLAYMNEEAFQNTLKSGRMTYYSRSRKELWVKGDTSGHYQYVRSLTTDCDKDTILARVAQVGSACHTGAKNCFFNTIIDQNGPQAKNPARVLETVMHIINDRKVNPKEGSYTNYLFDKGLDKILKKVGEEATEIIIAAKNPNANEIKYEIADFLYHLMVLMAEQDVNWDEIMEELSKR
ncbi:MAG: bifunctional phosphoribosyl-AMP cyclohydrolase/phosphoribosyl-ATP diphosphatase HisIE [Lachnospiraceae bacterium]|nr:bifunctional phosphoribosyl-AMP cyclohydrolase/phosphoribosyl-ATP diphosphatase HisIE [Lachnospiraceae bacterium]